MSSKIVAEAVVRSPYDARPRRGRGFSRGEIAKAALSIREARRMGLIVDIRRQTVYDENISALEQYKKDLEAFASAIAEGPADRVDRDAAIAALSSLRGVKKAEAEALYDAGVETIEDLAYCEIPTVANKTGIPEDRITTMVKAALRKV